MCDCIPCYCPPPAAINESKESTEGAVRRCSPGEKWFYITTVCLASGLLLGGTAHKAGLDLGDLPGANSDGSITAGSGAFFAYGAVTFVVEMGAAVVSNLVYKGIKAGINKCRASASPDALFSVPPPTLTAPLISVETHNSAPTG